MCVFADHLHFCLLSIQGESVLFTPCAAFWMEIKTAVLKMWFICSSEVMMKNVAEE